MIINPICDPFTNLPVKFDIKEIALELKPKVEQRNTLADTRPQSLKSAEEVWDVLPKFKGHLDHLKPVLSTRTDPYMRTRWRKFLDNVPKQYVTVKVLETATEHPQIPKKLTLNGQFYGVDYKLAPIPQSPDPRKNMIPNKIKAKSLLCTVGFDD